MEEKVIYAKWLAFELRKQGFKLIRTDINENFPQFNTYVFEFTPALDEAIAALTARKD